MPITPALGRQRQEDCKFKAHLGYIAKTLMQNPETLNLLQENTRRSRDRQQLSKYNSNSSGNKIKN
jgi:hypothetical protein